jgi:hypothetical protein
VPDFSADPGAAGVLESDAGLGLEAADFFPRPSRGGSSLPLLSIPTGTSSALRVVFGASVPFGK